MLKTLRLIVLPVILLALAAPAWADDINMILDPGTPPQVGSFYLIQSVGTLYDVAWGSCTQPGVPSSMSGDAGCMLFINQTGQPITDLLLSFTVNSVLAGQTVTCTNLDSYLTSNTCAANGTLTLGQMVNADFFGGTPIPDESAFFIGENGVPYQNLPPLTLDVPAHDPSTLLLLAVGIGMLALSGIRRFA